MAFNDQTFGVYSSNIKTSVTNFQTINEYCGSKILIKCVTYIVYVCDFPIAQGSKHTNVLLLVISVIWVQYVIKNRNTTISTALGTCTNIALAVKDVWKECSQICASTVIHTPIDDFQCLAFGLVTPTPYIRHILLPQHPIVGRSAWKFIFEVCIMLGIHSKSWCLIMKGCTMQDMGALSVDIAPFMR